MPSVISVSSTLQRSSCFIKEDGGFPVVDLRKTYYVLNPDEDLEDTQDRLLPVFNKHQFKGLVKSFPSPQKFIEALMKNDMFIFDGHGSALREVSNDKIRNMDRCPAAILTACTSGALELHGSYIPMGPVLDYLFAGSPAIASYLWVADALESLMFYVLDFQILRFWVYVLDDFDSAVILIFGINLMVSEALWWFWWFWPLVSNRNYLGVIIGSKGCVGVGRGHTRCIRVVAFAKKSHNFFVSGSRSLDDLPDDVNDSFILKSKAVRAVHDKDTNTQRAYVELSPPPSDPQQQQPPLPPPQQPVPLPEFIAGISKHLRCRLPADVADLPKNRTDAPEKLAGPAVVTTVGI
nr:separase isoform X1 [Tanacetum cinerariifolium]